MENCEKHSKNDYCDRASRCDGKCYDCDDNECENNPMYKLKTRKEDN